MQNHLKIQDTYGEHLTSCNWKKLFFLKKEFYNEARVECQKVITVTLTSIKVMKEIIIPMTAAFFETWAWLNYNDHLIIIKI